MKKLFTLLLLFVTTIFFGQYGGHVDFPENVNQPLTKEEKAKIETVFKEFAQTIYKSPGMLKNYKDILRNRVKLYEIDLQKYQQDPTFFDIPELSSVPLNNSYNASLTKDLKIDPKTFNPFKYELDLFPDKLKVYRQGNYLINIVPQKRKKQ